MASSSSTTGKQGLMQESQARQRGKRTPKQNNEALRIKQREAQKRTRDRRRAYYEQLQQAYDALKARCSDLTASLNEARALIERLRPQGLHKSQPSCECLVAVQGQPRAQHVTSLARSNSLPTLHTAQPKLPPSKSTAHHPPKELQSTTQPSAPTKPAKPTGGGRHPGGRPLSYVLEWPEDLAGSPPPGGATQAARARCADPGSRKPRQNDLKRKAEQALAIENAVIRQAKRVALLRAASGAAAGPPDAGTKGDRNRSASPAAKGSDPGGAMQVTNGDTAAISPHTCSTTVNPVPTCAPKAATHLPAPLSKAGSVVSTPSARRAVGSGDVAGGQAPQVKKRRAGASVQEVPERREGSCAGGINGGVEAQAMETVAQGSRAPDGTRAFPRSSAAPPPPHVPDPPHALHPMVEAATKLSALVSPAPDGFPPTESAGAAAGGEQEAAAYLPCAAAQQAAQQHSTVLTRLFEILQSVPDPCPPEPVAGGAGRQESSPTCRGASPLLPALPRVNLPPPPHVLSSQQLLGGSPTLSHPGNAAAGAWYQGLTPLHCVEAVQGGSPVASYGNVSSNTSSTMAVGWIVAPDGAAWPANRAGPAPRHAPALTPAKTAVEGFADYTTASGRQNVGAEPGMRGSDVVGGGSPAQGYTGEAVGKLRAPEGGKAAEAAPGCVPTPDPRAPQPGKCHPPGPGSRPCAGGSGAGGELRGSWEEVGDDLGGLECSMLSAQLGGPDEWLEGDVCSQLSTDLGGM